MRSDLRFSDFVLTTRCAMLISCSVGGERRRFPLYDTNSYISLHNIRGRSRHESAFSSVAMRGILPTTHEMISPIHYAYGPDSPAPRKAIHVIDILFTFS